MRESYQQSPRESIDLETGEVFGESAPDDFLPDGVEGLEIQGGRVTYRKPVKVGERKGGGVRGRVKGMSDASRRRLMSKFASLGWEQLIALGVPFHFVTLTTPEEYWTDVKRVYLALRRFRRLLRAHYGSRGYLGAFVRRERGQARGMLHYHLITVGAAGLSPAWVTSTWSKCLAYEGRVRCDVQFPENPKNVAKYLSKYCSKAGYEGAIRPPEGGQNTSSEGSAALDGGETLSKAHNGTVDGESEYTGGRWWYVWGADLLPWSACYAVTGDDGKQLAKRLRRLFRRWSVQVLQRRTFKRCEMHPDLLAMLKSKSVRWWSRLADMRFCESLRRYGGGFTFLLAPDLLDRFLECAAMAEIYKREEWCPF